MTVEILRELAINALAIGSKVHIKFESVVIPSHITPLTKTCSLARTFPYPPATVYV